MAVRRPGSMARILSISSIGARGLAELVLPDAASFSSRPTLRARSDVDLRGLRVELDARAHAAAVGLRDPAGGGASSAESASKIDGVARIDAHAARRWAIASSRRRRCRSAMSAARRSAATRTFVGRVAFASPTQVRTRSSWRPRRWRARSSRSRVDDVVGVEREGALGVVGRLVGAAEAVEDLGEPHVLVGDHLGRGARRRAGPPGRRAARAASAAPPRRARGRPRARAGGPARRGCAVPVGV